MTHPVHRSVSQLSGAMPLTPALHRTSAPLISPPSAEAQPNSPVLIMTWKNRGIYHLERKEFELAIDAFTKALAEAEECEDPQQVAESLKDLGRVFLEKGQWVLSAKILNGALGLCSDKKLEETILFYMVEIEKGFLKNECGINANPSLEIYLARRQELKKIRGAIEAQIERSQDESGPSSKEILLNFSEAIALFLEKIVTSGYPFLGNPPCEFVMMGLGSLARKEMSPFSDLEFALLVENSSSPNLDYFRKLVRWFEIQMIHLGETEIKILQRGLMSPVPRGFSFDDGGNTPLGKQGYVELIKIPQEMAQYQLEQFYHEDLILSNILRTTNTLFGKESLFKDYLKAMQEILDKKSPKTTLSIRQQRALNLIDGHLVEFEPRVNEQKEQTPVFDVKMELYRLPNFLIGGLADFYGIEEQNTWDRLEVLGQRKILCEEGVKNLQQALAAIMFMRIACHLHYEKECDMIFHPSIAEEAPQNALVLLDEGIEGIISIYRVLLPLYRAFKGACGDFQKLSQETFYDDSLIVQAEAYERLFQYQKAKECYQQALALDPDDIDLQFLFVNLLYRLAEYEKAKEYVDRLESSPAMQEEPIAARVFCHKGLISLALGDPGQATGPFVRSLELIKKIYGDEHPSVAIALNNLGLAWRAKGSAKEAVGYLEEGLRIYKKTYGNEHPQVASALNNLGAAYETLGNAKKALECFEKALGIEKTILGDAHPNIAKRLNNLGIVSNRLGNPKKAIEYLEEALSITEKIYGDEHPEGAVCLNNLGDAWIVLKNFKKALWCFEKALRIDKKFFGDNHPKIALRLNNLGAAYLGQSLGGARKAIEYFEEAGRIFGEDHPEIGMTLNNIGNAWRVLGNFKTAIEYLEKALEKDKKVMDSEHPKIARRLNNLSAACIGSGDHQRAIQYSKEALEIYKKVYGDVHPEVAACLNNLGIASESVDKAKAIQFYEEALRIDRKVDGEHPDVARDLTNLGSAWIASGNAKKAIGYLEEALKILKSVYGDAHIELVKTLLHLGNAWSALVDMKHKTAFEQLKSVGDAHQVVDYYKQALKILKTNHANPHIDVARCLLQLAEAWEDLKDFKEVTKCYEEALMILRAVYGDENSSVARCLHRLGGGYRYVDAKKAIVCLEEALKIDKKVQGPDHVNIAIYLNGLGLAYRALGDAWIPNAIECFEKARPIFAKCKEHINVVVCLDNLGLAYKAAGDAKKAIEYYEEALEILKSFYGDNHSMIAQINSHLKQAKGDGCTIC